MSGPGPGEVYLVGTTKAARHLCRVVFPPVSFALNVSTRRWNASTPTLNASSFADSVSMSVFPFAVNLSTPMR